MTFQCYVFKRKGFHTKKFLNKARFSIGLQTSVEHSEVILTYIMMRDKRRGRLKTPQPAQATGLASADEERRPVCWADPTLLQEPRQKMLL